MTGGARGSLSPQLRTPGITSGESKACFCSKFQHTQTQKGPKTGRNKQTTDFSLLMTAYTHAPRQGES